MIFLLVRHATLELRAAAMPCRYMLIYIFELMPRAGALLEITPGVIIIKAPYATRHARRTLFICVYAGHAAAARQTFTLRAAMMPDMILLR